MEALPKKEVTLSSDIWTRVIALEQDRRSQQPSNRRLPHKNWVECTGASHRTGYLGMGFSSSKDSL